MRATGIIRRIDDLGRVVIPKEVRRSLRIREGELLEIFFNDKGVFFQKMDIKTNFIDEIDKIINTYNDDVSGEITALLTKAKDLAIKTRKERGD